tara:strand:+ start:860 stop:1108 length:249 start_codon:yes stop_codon:yes gene_type:complete
MKAIGLTTIKGLDQQLESPIAKISNVVYNWLNDTASIEVIFQEAGANYKHSISFEMDTKGNQQTASKIREFINKQLINFEQP